MNAPPPPRRPRASLTRMFGNAASVLSSDAANRVAAFTMYALVARHLGAHAFGQLSLAFSLFYVFKVLSSAGLRPITTRAIAQDRGQTDAYLVNGSLIVLIASLLSMLLLGAFVAAMGYADDTAALLLLLGLGLAPFAWSQLLEAIFQAWEKMEYIAYGNVPVNVAKVVAMFIALSRGHDIRAIVIINVVAFVLTAAIEAFFLARTIARPRLTIDAGLCRAILTPARTFLGIEGLIAVKASLGGVLLSVMVNEAAVGFYNAAGQVIVPMRMFFQNIAVSLYPSMCHRVEAGMDRLRAITDHVVEILIAISLPLCLVVFTFPDRVLLLLYRDTDFLQATGVLRVLIWIPLLNALTTILGQVLWASKHERTSLRIVATNTLLKLAVSLFLIARAGLMGAAIATLIVETISLVQHYAPIRRLLPDYRLHRQVWRPALAAGVTAGWLALAIHLSPGTATTAAAAVLSAMTVYGALLLGLVVRSAGGFRRLKAQVLEL